MGEHLDTSWCPVCDRHIESKRLTVVDDRRGPQLETQANVSGGQHGLVHGTGALAQRPARPQQGQQDADSDVLPPAPPSSPAPRNAQRPRVRTVISHEQTPLYCSERCRQEDQQRVLVAPHSSSVPVVAAAATTSTARPVPTLSISAAAASTPVVSPQRSPAILLSSPTDPSPSRRELPPSTPPSPRFHDPIAGIAPITLNRPNKPKLLHVGSSPNSLTGHQLFADAVSARRPLPLPRTPEALDADPFESRMPAGWRAGETEWRKALYGDFMGAPKSRPSVARMNSLPLPTRDTLLDPSSPPPVTPPADLELYDRFNASFSRRNRDSPREERGSIGSTSLLPSSHSRRRLSSSTVSSTATHSSSGSSARMRSSLRGSLVAVEESVVRDSDSEDDSEGVLAAGFSIGGGKHEYPSLFHLSVSGSVLSNPGLLSPPLRGEDRTRPQERRLSASAMQSQHKRLSQAVEATQDRAPSTIRRLFMGRRTLSSVDIPKG